MKADKCILRPAESHTFTLAGVKRDVKRQYLTNFLDSILFKKCQTAVISSRARTLFRVHVRCKDVIYISGRWKRTFCQKIRYIFSCICDWVGKVYSWLKILVVLVLAIILAMLSCSLVTGANPSALACDSQYSNSSCLVPAPKMLWW